MQEAGRLPAIYYVRRNTYKRMNAQIVRRNPVFSKSRDEFAVTLNPHEPANRKVIMVCLDKYSGKSGAVKHMITFGMTDGNVDEVKSAVLGALSSRIHRGPNDRIEFNIVCKEPVAAPVAAAVA